MSWINEICSGDTEKRALLIAVANDLAYVVQAVAPNFVWKTTDFPSAQKGYMWSIVLQVLLIVWTGLIQLLLWRDKRNAVKKSRGLTEESDERSVTESQDSEPVRIDEYEDGKKVVRVESRTVR